MRKCAKNISLAKKILYIIAVSMIGCAGIVFSVLYIDSFDNGIFYSYSSSITAVTVAIITCLTLVSIMLYELYNKIFYKIFLVSIILITTAIIVIYLFKKFGILEKFQSIESFREYIASKKGFAEIIFIIIQFLQVVVLPIPSFVTVGAGVLLFGPLKSAIYSCIGIILGSIVAFFVGKFFGKKVAQWLVGKNNLEKGLKFLKGKDKIVLTFMFLFPFFPDDILCFVAGISTVNTAFFMVMIFVTRTISIFCASFSMNNNLIPFDTWWGILLWIFFFAFTIFVTVLIYKKGNKIEQFFKSKKNKKKPVKNKSKYVRHNK